MWQSLGTSVDINLDNLSPYSKGTKTSAGSNLPMNALMSNNPQSQSFNPSFNNSKQPTISTGFTTKFASPPMSPSTPNSNVNKNSNNSNINSLSNDLFDLKF